MKLLILGDIMGASGRKALISKLPDLITTNKIDFVIVNGENASDDGRGITKEITEDFFKIGVDVINLVNEMYDLGNTIIYWTARGTVTGINWLDLTRTQLNSWGVKYHDVRVGKPAYDLFICDKTKRMEELL